MAASAAPGARVGLNRLPPHAWGLIVIILLTIAYVIVQAWLVRPYLWPAGTGARLSGDPAATFPLVARPPEFNEQTGQPFTVIETIASGPAAQAGVVPGTRVSAIRRANDLAIDLEAVARHGARARLDAWRQLYWTGVSGPVTWTIPRPDGTTPEITIDRPPVSLSDAEGWSRLHLGMIVRIVVFTVAAVALLLLRGQDLTAGLSVLAFTLAAVGGAGPLLGAESAVPLGRVLTVFAWIASPFVLPVIALAILYFPTPSPLLTRCRWLGGVPFLVAAPMIGASVSTALYLAELEAFAGIALWNAMHPGAYYGSFVAALGTNVLALGEAVHRYRINHDANERRRIRMAVYTAVPAVVAYTLNDGLPILTRIAGGVPPRYPLPMLVVLHGLVLLPAFGLTYALGGARVLGPRIVLRRSLQYALARRTLTAVTVLSVIGLALSIVRNRNMTVGQIAASSSGLYVLLIAAILVARRYRERAQLWLDRRFFREEYNARKILLLLAGRVRLETDPAHLTTMVVKQIDEALHPQMVAILVSGVEDGLLAPVTVLHGSAESLPLDGALVSMLRWSGEPLEIFLQDRRSPVRRLPREEQEWLQCTGASLLVPILARDRSLVAVIALAERRSEEAYTDEDRQLLASVAAQMGPGFDVARLRRAEAQMAMEQETAHMTALVGAPMMECPKCGRCDDPGTLVCQADGSTMVAVPSVSRVVDHKYRIEQLLGRGGMGTVYRARDVRLDRLVALKVVRAERLGDSDARQRFLREAQIVARLQHPSIVAVFDYGTFTDGGVYLVMELVRGEDLRHVLQREGRIESRRAMQILDSVCAAVDAAHREGVLHRDLKPENILVPAGGVAAKVLDFGVANVVSNESNDATRAAESPALMTAAGMIVGTPAYMAPEQFHAAPPDARTDVFSLGVIAYEMLSGELPFGRGSLGEIVLARARGAPAMPAGSAPPAVERAIRSALDPDPDRRPASARAFALLVVSAMEM